MPFVDIGSRGKIHLWARKTLVVAALAIAKTDNNLDVCDRKVAGL